MSQATYLVDIDGNNRRWLKDVRFLVGPNPPAWSPDGKRLAYIDQADVYVMDADGKNSRQITFVVGRAEASVDWSPDGKMLVFDVQLFNPAKHGLHLITADGGNERRLTDLPDGQPQWLPNGQQIIFSRVEEINPPFPKRKRAKDY